MVLWIRNTLFESKGNLFFVKYEKGFVVFLGICNVFTSWYAIAIKNEVYLNLVKQYEQNKIQAAMESMDIQIVDMANLPDIDKPVAPRKKLIVAIGFVVGILIAMGYSLRVYRREA